jgi:hypothetical protein
MRLPPRSDFHIWCLCLGVQIRSLDGKGGRNVIVVKKVNQGSVPILFFLTTKIRNENEILDLVGGLSAVELNYDM